MKKKLTLLISLFLPLMAFASSNVIDEDLAAQRALNPKLEAALNKQVQKEFSAFYMYIGLSSYFMENDLPGFGHWAKLQANEEYAHAMKIVEFIQDRGGKVTLEAIQPSPSNYTSPLAAIESALNAERGVTLSIHNLYSLAQELKEYDSLVFLQWYINEQVEEESSVYTLANRMSMMMESFAGSLYMIDQELGGRES
jgi:ferritin